MSVQGEVKRAFKTMKIVNSLELVMSKLDPSTSAAQELACAVAERFVREVRRLAPGAKGVPRFFDMGDGSIRLHWDVKHGDMKMSIPADGESFITYKGVAEEGVHISGKFGVEDSYSYLAFWMAENFYESRIRSRRLFVNLPG